MSDDTISRKATIDAIEGVDWYHIDSDGQLTHGANSKEGEPLYKAKDVYAVLNTMSSAQPKKRTEERTETHACDLISRRAAIDALDKRFDSIPMEQTTEILLLRKDLRELPSAQPDSKELSFTHKALDTISRQDAIRIVDGIDTWQAGWRGNAIESMKALPSAQPEVLACGEGELIAQPEIIRCNACKHWTQTTGNMRGFGLGDCDYINAKLVNCNGFCHWAERRTDE